jgi:metal-responsive CopG/Arc/MetJ family transcriptional regulator
METISLKMEETLLKDIDTKLKNFRYSTRTEFIRDAIRQKLNDLEKEEAIRKLVSFKGSLKGKAKMGEKEASKLADLEIAKKFGIKLD